MINRIKYHIRGLRLQLLFVLLISGSVSLSLFQVLWKSKTTVYSVLCTVSFLHFPSPGKTFVHDLAAAAPQYEVPDSENDTEKAEKLLPFFSMADEYTSIYIYGADDGLFRAGQHASRMYVPDFPSFFNVSYSLSETASSKVHEQTLNFKNGPADVVIYYYHSSWFLYLYFYFCIIFCILLFLGTVLCFIGRKMKRVIILKKEILRMSSGDLEHPVPACGYDEIGTLAAELDNLRLTLSSNILQAQESRRANQDLITAMSHDLRTPLTILGGYLEILKLGRTPTGSGEYLDRCLKKTEEIRELTDRMFEYALVYEETENVNLTALPAAFLQQCLTENIDYIRLTGFTVEAAQPDALPKPDSLPPSVLGDSAMLRRVFSNLFSNIIKYGDKKAPVQISSAVRNDAFIITLSNTVRQEHVRTESNHIGLKSVHKMMTLMEGGFQMQNTGNRFEVTLSFRCFKN